MKRFGLLILLLACFGAVVPAQAFEIQPAILDVAADPGSRQQVNIRLHNDETEQVTYFVTVEKFLPSGENGQQIFLGPNDTAGLPEWTFVDTPSITLRPNESINFPVSIRIPSEVKAGAYMEAIFFSPSPSNADGNAVSTAPRIGALLFVTVSGQISQTLSLESFQVNREVFNQLPVDFSIRLRNEGNGIAVPEGEIRITNVFGATVATLPINKDAKRILPNSVRVLPLAWDNRSFAIGPYTATLSINQAKPIKANVRFYVWPWVAILWGIGGLILLVIVYVFLKRMIIRRATA